MSDTSVIGVDMGGTKIMAARIEGERISDTQRRLVTQNGTEKEVIEDVITTIKDVLNSDVAGIGIGVPSVVDVENGIVYDVQNIPSWNEVPLKQILEDKFQVPVYINNDANCFAVGEKVFGKGKAYDNLIGLIIGTGMAGGIIINGQLYNGNNCGAGEFGMMPYLDKYYEFYCSGQYFSRQYETTGEKLFEEATNGNESALRIFKKFGHHVGNAVMSILYAYDPEVIILGGSVSKSFAFWEKTFWKELENFAYSKTVERLKVEVSENADIALLGAAALYYNANPLASNQKL